MSPLLVFTFGMKFMLVIVAIWFTSSLMQRAIEHVRESILGELRWKTESVVDCVVYCTRNPTAPKVRNRIRPWSK